MDYDKDCLEMSALPTKKRRMRAKPNKKWTKADLEVLLQCVLFSKNSFEKPTAQIFYRKIIEREPILEGYEWCGLRDKMRNLRKKYQDAIDWRNGTGAGLTDEDKEETIQGYILKLCPDFKILDEIFGSKFSIHPLHISDSGVPENQEALSSGEPSSVVQLPDVTIEYVKSDENGTAQNQEESVDAQQFIKKLSNKPSSSDTPRRRSSASTKHNSVTYLAQVQEARVAQLSEISKEQRKIDDKRLELESQVASKEAEIKKQHLELEKSRLQFEIEKWREQSRLAELEIERKNELDRFRIEKEVEIKKYELDLKYKFQ